MAKTRPLIVVWRDMILTEDVNLSPMAGYVGCALAKFADSNGRSCFPSQKKIAAVTRYSLRSVQRAIGELEDAGWITTKMVPIKGGKNQIRGQAWRTTYGFNLPEEAVTQSPSNTEEDATESPSVAKRTPHSHEEHATQSPYLEQRTKNTYTADFEKFRSVYPKRSGNDPKLAASRKWDATLGRGEATPSELILAASHYRDEMEREGKIGTPFVMQGQTFLGPTKRWTDYTKEATAERREQPYGGSLS